MTSKNEEDWTEDVDVEVDEESRFVTAPDEVFLLDEDEELPGRYEIDGDGDDAEVDLGKLYEDEAAMNEQMGDALSDADAAELRLCAEAAARRLGLAS